MANQLAYSTFTLDMDSVTNIAEAGEYTDSACLRRSHGVYTYREVLFRLLLTGIGRFRIAGTSEMKNLLRPFGNLRRWTHAIRENLFKSLVNTWCPSFFQHGLYSMVETIAY